MADFDSYLKLCAAFASKKNRAEPMQARNKIEQTMTKIQNRMIAKVAIYL
jgi:hypothetical protein